MDQPYSDRYWTSPDGLQLHYRDYPGPEGSSAVPALCMHGLTRNSRDFEDLADHLAKDRRVIVPEMRGRGLSDYAKDSATYTPLVYVADVQALLAELELERVIAIGTSMGGLMTMFIAAMAPGQIAGAVLNDIGPQVETAGIERISGYVGQGRSFPTWMHAARALQEIQSDAFPNFTIDNWLEMAKRTMVLGQNGRISFDYDMAIAEPFKDTDNAAPPDLWPAFDALKGSPLLLLRGELSDLLTEETVAEMARRHGDMKSVTVAGVGHAPTLDEPESVAAIDELLARIA